MPKNYVIDTNVLLIDPDAIFQFGDNNVILPLTVIEEVDTFKKPKRPEDQELARAARQVARNLKELMKRGRIDEGVTLDNGGTIRVVLTISQTLLRLPIDLAEDLADNRILSVAIDYKAILVSNDTNMAIKAVAVGLEAQEYKANAIKSEDFYTGTSKGYITEDSLNKIYDAKQLDLSEVTLVDLETPFPNQCFLLQSMDNPKHSALARYDSVMQEFKLLPLDMKTLGLIPKNSEQQHALNLLLDPEIKLVSMIGKAGSGKTLLALAAGIHGVLESKLYTKVMLLKPIVAMDNGHQLGFLPGSMEEKLSPWLASYYDNISFIMGAPQFDEAPMEKVRAKSRGKGGKCKSYDPEEKWEDKSQAKVSAAEELIALGLLELGSLEHIRGRSLPNQYIIIDEAQGLTHNAIKTIITRAGEGTKVILMGDVEQIDLPYLSADNNGLVYVADRFKEEPIAGHITLTRTVRSELAEKAAQLL